MRNLIISFLFFLFSLNCLEAKRKLTYKSFFKRSKKVWGTYALESKFLISESPSSKSKKILKGEGQLILKNDGFADYVSETFDGEIQSQFEVLKVPYQKEGKWVYQLSLSPQEAKKVFGEGILIAIKNDVNMICNRNSPGQLTCQIQI